MPVQLTIWNLLAPVLRRFRTKRPQAAAATARAAASRPKRPRTNRQAVNRYEEVTRLMLAKHGVKVRRWRSSMSGVAWELRYQNGDVVRLLEAPRPKGPMSMAIFLHEIGHHAIGFNRYRPRCLEEYHAWAWAIAAMEEHGLNVTEGVRRRMALSLWYAVSKARRRGLAALPPELEPYQHRPARRSARRESVELAA